VTGRAIVGTADRDVEVAALLGAMASLGLAADALIANRLVDYLDLLERWNAVYNLSAVRDRPAMRVQHLHDSLAIAAALERSDALPRHGSILDVGSGAGLPGLVLAACRPDGSVTCVDAVGKKVAFVAQAAAALGLANATALHARVETVQRPPVDLVTARAFATLADTVQATRHLLAPTGVWALAKGRSPSAEIDALPASVEMFHVERLHVPDLAAERHLVWLRPRTTDSDFRP
jgi:16S rRNA (guanine527-N7)-methyltransferase